MQRISFLIVTFLSLFSFSSVFAYSDIRDVGENAFCKIAKVDDGDTFDLDCTAKYYPNVRLLAVNAPDINLKSGKKSCFYDEAKKILQARMDRIYKVEFYGRDLCKDPYKGCRNLVRLIDVEKDFDLGQRMIERGFAFSWTNFSMVPSTVRESYQSAENTALVKKRGIWETCEIERFKIARIDSPIPDKMSK